MARAVVFEVTDASARRRCVGPDIRRIAEAVAADAASRTPSSRVAAAYKTEPGRDPGTTLIINEAKNSEGRMFARYLEYGTFRMPARPSLGPAMAAAGYPRWPRRR